MNEQIIAVDQVPIGLHETIKNLVTRRVGTSLSCPPNCLYYFACKFILTIQGNPVMLATNAGSFSRASKDFIN